ncbi:hypothetical protein FQV39_28735 [Bosea sp. F3-2]|uniref:hypothetical protein n=1 Tax=Bosea sp. F3-2 TaxID=2599640 RepID=UPI0011EFD09D|nr:hypothetical protein [Bosea sp. F3-2]QEL26151.1 hypothetical protein FQV39_28735 [Bosea sp. F3-2]
MSLTKTVVLADKEARVPWPNSPGRFLPNEPFEASLIDPFFAALIADESLVDPPPDPPAETAPPPKSKP